MNAEKFWTLWLKVTMIMIILTGFSLIALYLLGESGFLDSKIDQVFFHGASADKAVEDMRSWMVGLAGAVMAGWGFSMLFLVNYPFRNKEGWAWKSIFYPALLWYVLDTGISVYYEVWFNVAINTVLLFQLMAPMLFLWNQFFSQRRLAHETH